MLWMEDLHEVGEIFKGCLPYYLIVMLFIIISPVESAHEIPVYRMQHYDLHGLPHGCRNAVVNLEARSLSTWSTNRHCVIARLQDITSQQLRDIRSKAGALFIVLPQHINSMSAQMKQTLLDLEEELLSQEVFIPVYFMPWSAEVQGIVDDVSTSMLTDEKAGSAAEALFNTISANGYQVVVNAGPTSFKADVQVANIQGKLSGQGVEENLPTIALVAHYDSFGAAPELSFGADSNGSGVATLLELARIFSSLYSSAKTHASYNIIFLLSGAGKLNYLGSKRWLEDQMDSLEASLVQDAAFVLCLDSLASNTSLHLHVSKPPKESSIGGLFYKELESVAETSKDVQGVKVQMVHKKINLADDLLAWEHERYSIRRLPAFTLSALKSHRDLHRTTILDRRDTLDLSILTRNTALVAEALARLMYGLNGVRVLSEHVGVETEALRSTVDLVTSQPRSAQLLAEKNSPLVATLREALAKYVKEVKVTTLIPDKRDPDFVFYEVTKAVVNIYSVKPAVFDLFLTIVIVIYLGLVYLLLNHFSIVYTIVTKLVTPKKKSH